VLAAYVANEDLDFSGRVLGIWFLERLGARGFDILAQLGASPHLDWRIKILIGQSLVAARDERSAEPLAQLAADTAIDGRTRFMAAELLSALADPRSAGLLQSIGEAKDADAQLRYDIALLLMHRDSHAGQRQFAAVSSDARVDPRLRHQAAEQHVRLCGLEGFAVLAEVAHSSGDSGLLVFALDVVARWKGTTARALFGHLPAQLALDSARQMIQAGQSAQISAQPRPALVA
jgi:hypothetical protein